MSERDNVARSRLMLPRPHENPESRAELLGKLRVVKSLGGVSERRRARPRQSRVAYYVLTRALLGSHGRDSELARALGNDLKGKVSAVLYAAAVPLSFVSTWLALGIYLSVALTWLVPDTRIVRVLKA